ncbi:type II toxin-antitoxin system antitoxin DNA ADP-ribosyl glycohydrolase DarG [Parafrankia elaeagni]|uniref:type II toxin-antitoxin system antitoxin DNA ADP-ribosyl glycohydrolase DarG n=1 Tax=Parafrankia elaeagni TaxID=222534 RepID=UPI001E42A193|nr:macro domain-containing protein [Parafrankia elaeagni]
MTEVEGNLLAADVDALVNTVNTVGVMGKGIALQFKRAFPENYDSYSAACSHGEVQLGRMFVSKLDSLSSPYYIINFPTKSHWKSKSRITSITEGLTDLVRVIRELNISSIAVPPLGCGNGGLAWSEVRPIIVDSLSTLSDVDVRLYRPAGAPDSASMPVRTPRPRMTRIRAAILLAFERYIVVSMASGLSIEARISLIEAHKIAYLLQESGWPVGMKFARGHYGPYSEALNQLISSLEGHFIKGFGDGSSGSKAVLTLDPQAVREAHDLLDGDRDYWLAIEELQRTIAGYEFPWGLELLATVHYTSAHCNAANAGDVVSAVRSWSTRKSEIFDVEHARAAHAHLARRGLVASPSPSPS